MIPFVVIAGAMLVVALAWIVVPLLRNRGTVVLDREASNAVILRDQLSELERDVGSGALSAASADEARRELEQRVLQEASPAAVDRVVTPGAGRMTLWTIAALLPIVAVTLYLAWGNFAAFVPETQLAVQERARQAAQIEPLIAKLVARLEQDPGNAEGWVILARTYYALNRYADAVRAYERAAKLLPEDAGVMVDYADALAATQQSLEGKPMVLVMRALELDRGNWKALALAGTAAFDRKDYRQAVAYWEEMKALVPPEAPAIQAIDASIAEARQLGGMPPVAVARAETAAGDAAPAATPAIPPPATNTAAAAKGRIEGTVSLDPKLVAKARPGDTVFIFARAAEGPRMPLAILTRTVKDLPAKFVLDDSMAMSPNAMLSSAPQVIVGARVSRSGNAMPQSGDLEGHSSPVPVGATSVDVVIDRIVP